MDIVKESESALKSLEQKLHEELQAVRSNRPSVQLIEDVRVECYGQTLTVREMGSLSIQPPRDILVTVWDKDAVPAITAAIQSSKGGVSVSNDGTTIRVSLPTLTEERREEFVRLVKKMAEQTRIQVRTRRDEMMKRIKSSEDAKELNKDQAFKTKESVQKVVEGVNARIEAMVEAKVKELSE